MTKGHTNEAADNLQRLLRAIATLGEWAGEAVKEGNVEAAEAFALSLHLIKERLGVIATKKGVNK